MPEHLARLRARLEAGTAVVAQVGLGYVGLPVACMIADSGLQVVGLDLKAARVDSINAGRSPIHGTEPGLDEVLARVVGAGRLRATTDPVELRGADVILIAVETPVDEHDHRPRFAALRGACAAIAAVLSPGALVVVESTIAPGTIARLVVPELEGASGLRAGEDFFVGHCPERVMPGRLLRNLRQMSRVVGGQTPEVADAMAMLYRRFVDGELDLTDPLTAELVKTSENAYRDVNIAFANQIALVCEEVGGDAWRVRELVNKSPGRNVLLPGGGVGGHCIPKDSWLLAAGVDGADTSLLSAARRLNDSMPGHVAARVLELLAGAGRSREDAAVAVLGYAYLEDSDDDRNSPSAALVAELERAGIEVRVHDPFVREYLGELEGVVAGADCAVVMVGHSAYRALDLDRLGDLMRTRLLVDARNVIDSDRIPAGFTVRVVGRG